MKKIVGILAAAAVLATSVFAADVSAGVRLEGSLFNWDGSNASALKLSHNNQYYHAPISFSISDDKAGGQLKLTDLDANNGSMQADKDGNPYLDSNGNSKYGNVAPVVSSAWQIWFKPVDVLKITVGCWANTLNQEKIDWCNSDSKIAGDDGNLGSWVITLAPIDGLSIDLALTQAFGKAWFANSEIADMAFMMHYGADFGTISAMFDARSNFKDLRFGAGYANNFSGLDMFVNVLGFYNGNEFKKVRGEVYLGYAADALNIQAFIVGGYNIKGGWDASWWHVGNSAAAGAFVGMSAKFSYALDGITPYIYIKDANFLADSFSMTIKPGFTTNVGCCAIELACEITAASTIKVDVPVNFKVSF